MWNPPRPQVRLRALRLAPLAAAALLAACAPLQTRQSLQAVNVITLPHTGTPLHLLRDPAQQQDAQAQIDALLSKPLSADDAVRIALLGSPALQGLIAQTQADSADSTQSARLTNPVFRLRAPAHRWRGGNHP
ncbi:Putative Integral outer membrane protein TolC, efflux pump component (fragment) [Thiomonas sp. CB2]